MKARGVRRRGMGGLGCGLWWSVFVGPGCGLPEVVAEGVHVEVAADPGYALCGGTISHMDAFIVAVAAEFGVTAPTGEDRLEFFWVEEDYEARSPCPWESGGCTRGDRIFSRSAPHDHELVHALADFGWVPSFFNEGLAVAYGGIGYADEFDLGARSVYDTIEARDGLGVDYPMAGAFTWFLVERHGIAAILKVADDLPHGVRTSRVDRSFREILGVSLADSVDDFEEAVAVCPDRQWRAMLLECSAPRMDWDGEWFAEHRSLACAQEDVVGPYGGDTAIIFKTIEVEEGGRFDVGVIAEGGSAQVAISLCGGCVPTTWVRAGEGDTRVVLPSGRYVVRVVGPALADISVGWSLRRVRE